MTDVSPGLSRRVLLRGGGLVLVSASAAGCSFFSTDPDGGDGASGPKGPEAPSLAERVAKGELPAVADRLPIEADRLVVQPTEEMGAYGGTWRTAVTGGADGPWLHRTIGYEPLMRWTRDWSEAIPNVAKSVTPNADATEFQIVLRKGMKWSDGMPLTTADVEFAWDHVITNAKLNPAMNAIYQVNGKPMELEIVDDVTFVCRFDAPYALFPMNLARQVDGDRLVSHAKHYLETLHADFTDGADKAAKDAGYPGWVEYFNIKGNEWSMFWTNPELPSIKAWIVSDPLDEDPQAVFVRNPYYWKVDPEGSQLPYMDDVRYDVIPEPETMLLRAQNGDFDFHSRHFNSLENRPVLAESQESGNYHLLDLEGTLSNDMVIALNLVHEDAKVREVFRKKDFRVALSHAINRDNLINSVWQRQGEAYQAAPTPESKYYDEEFAKQYTEYNVDLANHLLDGLGYDERDSDGFRLREDGERISITVDVAEDGPITLWVQAMELVAADWAAVGVETIVNPMPRENHETRMTDNVQDATVWTGDGGRGDEIFSSRWYFPASGSGGSYYATQWSTWYGTRGADGQEPPDAAKEQMDLYDRFFAEPDEAARDAIFQEIITIAKQQFYAIGTVRQPLGYAIVSNRLHNVGGTMPEASTYDTPAPANPEQWFFKD